MPVVVVGADHPLGEIIVRRLAQPDREVRAFVSSAEIGVQLRTLGIKVAVGDLSDEGHLEAACTRCFGVIFVEDALTDGRELAFAPVGSVRLSWARVVTAAGVTRAIWVGDDPPALSAPEVGLVAIGGRTHADIAAEVAELDDVATLPGGSRFSGPLPIRNGPNRL